MSRTGIHASLGIAPESTYGTFVAPTRHVPIISESLSLNAARIDSDAIRAGRYTRHSDDHSAGKKMVEGTIEMEMYDRTVGAFLDDLIGGGTTTGVGPYSTPLIPQSSYGKSRSIQVGRPDVGGTTRVFSYQGCKTRSATISCAAGERVMLSADIIGQTETTSESLTAVSYASNLVPFTWDQATVTLQGVSQAAVKDITVTIEADLDEERLFAGASVIAEPLQQGLTSVAISGTMEFNALTFYANYTALTVAAYSVAFTDGTYSLTMAGTARLDGATPTISGREIVTIPFEMIAVGTTDAATFTATLVAPDTAP